ncbi:protein TAP1-like [Solanum dulcamara]|uniref:protein TAP1-like n=1 Tax=Solanum dulcamara TaxID=45834 RepID=UPI002485EC39|nr:protein TAP1-like [Solanum dulcamara]
MATKWLTLMLTMMVIFEGDLIMANLMEVKCIKHCMKNCKRVGIPSAACLKFCPLHCIPPPMLSSEVSHCNARCILEHCLDYKNEEEKLEGCASKCLNNFDHC